MNQRLKRIVVLLVVVFIIVGLVRLRSLRVRQLASEPTAVIAPLSVHVAKVRMGILTDTVDELGQVKTQTESTISPQVLARCLAVYKREGDTVHKGEIIAKLDSTELEQIAAASRDQYMGGRASAAAAGSLVQQAREDYVARLSDLDGARSAVAAQVAEAAAAAQNVQGARAQVSALRATLLSAKVAAVTQDARTERDKILYANQAISREQYEASLAARALARSTVTSLSSQIEAAQASVAASESRAAAVEQAVAGARSKVSALTAAASVAKARIVSQAKSAVAVNQQARGLANSLRTAETRVKYATLRAPYDGIVTARLAEPGDLIGPGQPVVRVQKPGMVRVIVNVPQELTSVAHVGNLMTLVLDGESMNVAISRIFPALSQAHQLTVEADLPRVPFGLRSGSTLSVRVHVKSQFGKIVPVDSVLSGDNGTVIFCVHAGNLQMVPVKVVSQQGGEYLVTGSLNANDNVVVGQQAQLMTMYSGEKVSALSLGDGNENS